MSRIVFVGKNPFYRDLLAYTRDRTGVDLVGAFHDPDRDPGIGRWLGDVGVESHALETLEAPAAAVPVLRRMSPAYIINFNAVIIFEKEILEVPSVGSLNMHPGLLPEYAGLHTHQWAIRNGESTFGSTVHWMEPRVDAGDIALREEFALSGEESGLSLYLECLEAGRRLVEQALDVISAGKLLPRKPQDLSRRTLYRDRDARDGTVDWRQDSSRILRFFRAADYGPLGSPTYTPRATYRGKTALLGGAGPGSPTEAPPGEVIAVESDRAEVACGDDRSILVAVQAPEDIDLEQGTSFQ